LGRHKKIDTSTMYSLLLVLALNSRCQCEEIRLFMRG
jgi:hypothetical protein